MDIFNERIRLRPRKSQLSTNGNINLAGNIRLQREFLFDIYFLKLFIEIFFCIIQYILGKTNAYIVLKN